MLNIFFGGLLILQIIFLYAVSLWGFLCIYEVEGARNQESHVDIRMCGTEPKVESP